MNIFADLPKDRSQEVFKTLVAGKNVRIERIVSHGQSSPEGFWYDQEQSEWVIVLQGEAKLLVEGKATPTHLKAGDHLTIPKHVKHRVEWTLPNEPTIWIAVFYD